MNTQDLRVYVITASVPELGRTHEDVAAAAIQGGATMIQFRDKLMDDLQFSETAARLLKITRAARVPLIINDRIAIALTLQADGVHIGWEDGIVRDVKGSLPPDMILGVSARNYQEAVEMNNAGADYLGVGPVFCTVSKEDAAPAIGVEELAKICRAMRPPVVAIGGIHCGNLRSIVDSGAAGAAVISAVSHAFNMTAAVVELHRAWQPQLR